MELKTPEEMNFSGNFEVKPVQVEITHATEHAG